MYKNIKIAIFRIYSSVRTFLLQCRKVKSESEVTWSCPTLLDPMDCRRLFHPWDCPGKSTGVGCHYLLRSSDEDRVMTNCGFEKEMTTHSRILAWRIPWTEEPGGLQSTGSQRVGHDWVTSLHNGWYCWMFFWLFTICLSSSVKCIFIFLPVF